MLVKDVCVERYVTVCAVYVVWLCMLGSASACMCKDMCVGMCVSVWVRMSMLGSVMGYTFVLLPTIMQGWMAPPKHYDPSVSLQEEKWGSEPSPTPFPRTSEHR